MGIKNEISSIDVQNVLYENRYCNQEGFSILVCGGRDRNYEVKIPSLNVTEIPSMVKPHNRLHLTTINSELFAIVNRKINYTSMGKIRTSVEVYSEKSKAWKH